MDKYAEGCFRLTGMKFEYDWIDTLLAEAMKSKLRRARVCIHQSDDDAVQEMFVLLMNGSPKGTYKYQRPSSKYLMRGHMQIAFYGLESVNLNAGQFIRIPADVYHTPTILSEYVLIHEIHQGPWTPDFMHKLTRDESIQFEREHALNG